MVKPLRECMTAPEEPETKSESERHARHEDSENTADECVSTDTERAYHGRDSKYKGNKKPEETRRHRDLNRIIATVVDIRPAAGTAVSLEDFFGA